MLDEPSGDAVFADRRDRGCAAAPAAAGEERETDRDERQLRDAVRGHWRAGPRLGGAGAGRRPRAESDYAGCAVGGRRRVLRKTAPLMSSEVPATMNPIVIHGMPSSDVPDGAAACARGAGVWAW